MSLNKKKSLENLVLSIFILALVFLGAVASLAYFSGYRYVNINGIRFSGYVENEQPIKGTISYGDGLTGKLERQSESAMSKITYSDGSVYEGSVKGVRRDGYGVLTYGLTGDVYTGEFSQDVMNGEGVYCYSNGDRYEGSFSYGLKSGFGKFTWADGSYYYGNFNQNSRHGTGEFRGANGESYIGLYNNDKRDGSGMVSVNLLNGEIYTGENILTFANGDVYVGDFLNDERSGYGIYTWTNGDYYEGEFEKGEMHGNGTYYFAGGRSPYSGVFEHGKIA